MPTQTGRPAEAHDLEALRKLIREEFTAAEERWSIELAASEGRLRSEVEKLSLIAKHEFERASKGLTELGVRIGQMDKRFAALEENLRASREALSQPGQAVAEPKAPPESATVKGIDEKTLESLKRDLEDFRARIERLEAEIFLKGA